jgi:5-amino-6-(5-phosphoribosylamino)uracil reductase
MKFAIGVAMRTTLVLAMSIDGKIANVQRDPDKFASRQDFWRLEKLVAAADGVLIGAGTLRAHGTTMRVLAEGSIADRLVQGLPDQPIQIVCSGTGDIPKYLKFFRQPVPRWLLTNDLGAAVWSEGLEFQKILVSPGNSIDWLWAWQRLIAAGIDRLCILGGAAIATALWQLDLVDELYLTICPLIIGGGSAPTLCDGMGLEQWGRLKLVSCEAIEDEVFLRYCRDVDRQAKNLPGSQESADFINESY